MSSSSPHPGREYRYFDFIMVAFVTVLICSNFISGPKRVGWMGLEFTAGVVFFPISYVFGDVLTEVYGYARSRRVVWAGFGAILFSSFVSWVVLKLPPHPTWPNQSAWETVFGNSPRIVASSMLAYWCGEFANSFTLAKMKIWTQGKYLWTRTIGSTIVGELVDSAVFYPLAWIGIWPAESIIRVVLMQYTLKVLLEVVLTPVTYVVVDFLKRAEHEDYYDINTDFNPFTLKE